MLVLVVTLGNRAITPSRVPGRMIDHGYDWVLTDACPKEDGDKWLAIDHDAGYIVVTDLPNGWYRGWYHDTLVVGNDIIANPFYDTPDYPIVFD